MFSRVLLAVDGSTCARRASAFGLELAATYGATVEVVHVVESDTRPPDDATAGPRERGEEILADAASAADDAGVDAETHLAEGRPAGAIVERADDGGADLLVLGRTGRTGLGERLLGGTLQRVLRRTGVPVLAVPERPATDPGEYGDVLVTTDGSESAERAAPYGADLARTYGGTLHLLSVLDVQKSAGVFDAGGVSKEFVDRLREMASEDVAALAAAADADDVDIVREVVRGQAHEGIREYVEDAGVDLVAMASHDETNLTGHVLGSTTDRVLRVVPVPVLVVPVV